MFKRQSMNEVNMFGVILQVITVSICLGGLNWFLRKSLSEDIRELLVTGDEDLCEPDEVAFQEYQIRGRN